MGKTWKVILAFIGIFLAGAVAGGFVSLRFAKVPPPQVLRQTVPEQQWVIGQMRRFVNELKLDEAQREQVKPALDRAAVDFRHLHRRSYRETMDIIERVNNEIAPMLTEEQKDKFEDIRWLQRKRIEDLMMGPPPKPVPVVPAQPKVAAPAQPKAVAPAKPVPAAPAHSEATTPAQPKAAAPAQPKAITPAKPVPAAPAQSEAATPAQPEAVAPAQSKAAAPAKPKAVTPAKPVTAVPAQSEAATPAQSEAAAPAAPTPAPTPK